MIVNQAALRGLTTNLSALFNKVFGATQTFWEKIATKVPSATGEENYKWLGKIPRMREWIGDKQIQNLEASDYTIKNKDYEVTVGVDRNDLEDDKLGIYNPIISDISQSAANFPDTLIFALLKGGFANKCYDGKAFFATDHKVKKANVSNMTTYKLTAKTYSEARAAMMSFKDENDNSLGIIPNLLVVAPALETKALEILKAEQINGTTNVWKDTAELLVVPELAGADEQWYLLCTTKALRPLIYQERKAPKFVSLINDTDENVFMRKQFLYSVEARANAGYGFWQLAFGSTGAANEPA